MANSISSVSENIQYWSARLLYALKNEMALLGYTSRNYEDSPSQVGSVININDLRISGTASVRSINGAVTVDDMSSAQSQVTMQHVYKAVKWDNLQQTFGNVNLLNESADRVATALADKADGLLTAKWSEIPWECGEVDGSAAFNSTDNFNALAKARQILTVNKAPRRDLQAVIGPTEAYNARTLPLYTQASQAGSAEQLREGQFGRILGFDLRESQNTISTATVSTAAEWGTSPLVNKAAGYAVGDTSIAVDALGTGTIKKGSIFALGGYNYTVTADATITANAATLSINPPLRTAVADNDPLTQVPHSAAGSVGFAYHPDAFLWIVRPLAPFTPGSGPLSFVQTDAESGLTVRVSVQSQVAGAAGTAMQETLTADFLCGAALIRPDFAVRISGQV